MRRKWSNGGDLLEIASWLKSFVRPRANIPIYTGSGKWNKKSHSCQSRPQFLQNFFPILTDIVVGFFIFFCIGRVFKLLKSLKSSSEIILYCKCFYKKIYKIAVYVKGCIGSSAHWSFCACVLYVQYKCLKLFNISKYLSKNIYQNIIYGMRI